MNPTPIINATGRAVIAVTMLIFAMGSIASVALCGEPHNSLHQSVLSWSYMLLIFTMLALGLESAAGTFIASAYGAVAVKPPATGS